MMQFVNIHAVKTPNPKAIKFGMDGHGLTSGAFDYASAEEAKGKSPLAEKLFAYGFVERVFVSQDFVTVQIDTEAVEWQHAMTDLRVVIKKHVELDEPSITEESPALPELEGHEADIRALIDQVIRPATRHDGGDITFRSFRDGVVEVELAGACVGCPFGSRTVKHGVEVLLQRELPGVVTEVTSPDVNWEETQDAGTSLQ